MIATYDNLNNHIAKHNDYVDYSSQNEMKIEKTTNYIAKRKKSEYDKIKAENDELKFRNKILTIALIGITFMALIG